MLWRLMGWERVAMCQKFDGRILSSLNFFQSASEFEFRLLLPPLYFLDVNAKFFWSFWSDPFIVVQCPSSILEEIRPFGYCKIQSSWGKAWKRLAEAKLSCPAKPSSLIRSISNLLSCSRVLSDDVFGKHLIYGWDHTVKSTWHF